MRSWEKKHVLSTQVRAGQQRRHDGHEKRAGRTEQQRQTLFREFLASVLYGRCATCAEDGHFTGNEEQKRKRMKISTKRRSKTGRKQQTWSQAHTRVNSKRTASLRRQTRKCIENCRDEQPLDAERATAASLGQNTLLV